MHGVRQVSVQNATVHFPAHLGGLIKFGDSVSPGNYFMVQDGNPIMSTKGPTAGKWLLPMYGELMQWEIDPAITNKTHQENLKEATGCIVLATNTDESLNSWEFSNFVNGGRPCTDNAVFLSNSRTLLGV